MGKNSASGRTMIRRDAGASLAFTRMARAGTLKPVIVHVEGDSDINLFRWITDPKVLINQNDGKPNVIKVVINANKGKKKGVVAIVDSDFDNILNVEPIENVFRTDTHDIETMMLKEDFLRISDPYLRDKKKNNKLSYDDIWNKIISIGTKIGKLRLISTEKDWNLNFKEAERLLDRDDIIFLNEDGPDIDFRKYISLCVPYGAGYNKRVSDIKDIYDKDKRVFDTWQICRGHDLSLIISIVYSKGMLGQRSVTRDEIENLLSSTYIASRKIKKTALYQSIKDWQNKNCGWKILNDELW